MINLKNLFLDQNQIETIDKGAFDNLNKLSELSIFLNPIVNDNDKISEFENEYPNITVQLCKYFYYLF